jgi:hypothetical protein
MGAPERHSSPFSRKTDICLPAKKVSILAQLPCGWSETIFKNENGIQATT